MKNKSLTLSLTALFFLPSCDGEDDSLNTVNWEVINKKATEETQTDKSKIRSFVGKQVLFTGNSQSISTNNVAGTTVTTTTDSSVEIIESFLPDSTSLSNGTVNITSTDSSIKDNSSYSRRFNEIVEEPGIYEFNLKNNAETATLLSFDEDNDKYITILTYKSDTLGVYERTSDQTINGTRSLTNETGIFEILD